MGEPPFSTTPWRGTGGTDAPPIVPRTVRTKINLVRHCDGNMSPSGHAGEIGVPGSGRRTPGLAHSRTCPSPQTTYLVVVSARRPIGPRAWSFCVEIPISAP